MYARTHTHGYTAITVGSSSSECPRFPSKLIKVCVRTLQNGIYVESLHVQWYMYTSAQMHTEVTVGSRSSDCSLLAVGSSDFSLLAVAGSDFFTAGSGQQ